MDPAFDPVQPSPFVRYRIPIAIGCAAGVLSLASIVCLFSLVRAREPIKFAVHDGSEETMATASGRIVVVDVSGAVKTSGVYHLPEGSRIEDALSAAGGITEHADSDYVTKVLNRAAVVKDGAKLYIPFFGNTGNSGNSIPGQNSPVISLTASSPININTSTADMLDRLPGVGLATAQKIIQNRPYQTIEELVTKKAVSRTVLEKIKDEIIL